MRGGDRCPDEGYQGGAACLGSERLVGGAEPLTERG